MLGPLDILEGATPRPGTRFFVFGCYDRRITFYAQQARALALIHALHDQGYLATNPRIAVIGAGAAGITAAAACALVTQSEVILFERASELMPLQSATGRRHLDPHIFDWPDCGTDDPVADLPILDWEKGTSRAVRADVEAEFEALAQRIGARLQRRMRHDITHIQPAANSFEVRFTRDWRPGDTGEPVTQPRIADADRFDMILLAIGFGLEPAMSVPGIANRSYWDDAGIPSGEYAGQAHPRFLISGNGDGALIDMVAAGSANFNHAEMIRTIVEHPGIDELFEMLREADADARAAEQGNGRFDYIGRYDAQLLGPATGLGLVAAVRQRLKPGVQLTLQTQHAEAFASTSSTLNRLAAWLVMRACDADGQASFAHVHCANIARAAPPDPLPYSAQHWFACSGTVFGVNDVIVRRGPEKDVARAPFDNLLAGFKGAHDAWLERHGAAARVPQLSREARKLFADAASAAGLPVSQREARALANLVPVRVQVRPVAGGLRWSGAIAPEQIVQAWEDRSSLEIYCPAAPAALGSVSAALLRAGAHGRRVTLVADPAQWQREAQRLTAGSLQAQGMALPRIENRVAAAVNRDPVEFASAALALRLNQAMDRWTLTAIDKHLGDYIANGRDPTWRIAVEAAPELRQVMRLVWEGWRAAFEADPALLARFLRLMICAHDDDDSLDVAGVLVGPERLTGLVRGTAVACMIASNWQATAPHGDRPGNLLRTHGGGAWRGHGCGADMIDGQPVAVCAADYMWQTEFVLLSLHGSLSVAAQAEESFGTIEPVQPTLDETGGTGQLIMTIDDAFRAAVKAGPAALHALLEASEARHFAGRGQAIAPDIGAAP